MVVAYGCLVWKDEAWVRVVGNICVFTNGKENVCMMHQHSATDNGSMDENDGMMGTVMTVACEMLSVQ